MEDRSAFKRGVIVGVLLMMVARSVVWLLTPGEHPDATTGRYVLNGANIVACGLTAWATARPAAGLIGKLEHTVAHMRRLMAGIRH